MDRSSTLFSRIILLSLVASTTWAAPLDHLSEASLSFLSSLFQNRQTLPTDFGSDTVTATIDGQPYSFTHHYGISLANTGDNDEVVMISGPVLAAVQSLLTDDFICPDTPVAPESRDISDSVPFVNERDDGQPIDSFDIHDTCFEPAMRWGLQEAIAGAGGLMDIVPINDQAAVAAAQVEEALTEVENRLISLIQTLEAFSWMTPNQTTAVAKILPEVYTAVQQGRVQDGKAVFKSKLFQPRNSTRSCASGKDAPVCDDQDCNGLKEMKCTTNASKGCVCYPLAYVYPGVVKDFDALDEAQDAMHSVSGSNFDSISPTCYGIGTQTYIQRDAAAQDIDIFCSGDKNGAVGTAYGIGSNNTMYLRISFTNDFTIGRDECSTLFYRILDSCDGNSPDNPGNFKHGGSIQHPLGATLKMDPTSGGNPYCNSGHSNKWIDFNVGVDAITQFCQNEKFGGTSGERHVVTYNKGQSSEVIVSLAFPQNHPGGLDSDVCIAQARHILTDCDPSDPVSNPDGNRYGGLYITSDAIVIQITPTVSPPIFPPDEIDTHGNAIGPSCSADKSDWADQGTIDSAIDALCVDGNKLGSASKKYAKSGLPGTYVHAAAKAVDAQSTYKQGATVCRAHAPWYGAIIANDCRFALWALRDKCTKGNGFYDSSYVYNCVEWTLTADESSS